MDAGSHWVEIRCSHPGLITDIPGTMDSPPPGVPAEGGALSLLLADPGERLRHLPTLYMGPQPVFADRDLDAAKGALVDWVSHIERSRTVPVYTMRAARFEGLQGLFAHELFNRGRFLRQLRSLGMEISPSPFVEFEGSHFSADGHPVALDFIVLAGDGAGPGVPKVYRGGFLVFEISTWRIGRAKADELSKLTRVLQGVPAFASEDPSVVIETARSLRDR